MGNGLEGFESVKSAGATWEPKQTGSEKNKDFVKLTPSEASWISGVYLGARTDIGKNNSTIHEIRMENVGDQAHVVGEMSPDNKVTVWGTGLLDKLISENVTPGQTIAIKWLGIQTPKTGTKPYHGWDVLVKAGVEAERIPGLEAPKDESKGLAAAVDINEADDDDLPF
jgi:hypothetical protein